jgi:hypothetical protein
MQSCNILDVSWCIQLCCQSTGKQAQEAPHVSLEHLQCYHTEGDAFLWQAIRSCITNLIPHDNQQPQNGDTLIHPTQRNSGKKHLSENDK